MADISHTTGNVGIGTSTPAALLSVCIAAGGGLEIVPAGGSSITQAYNRATGQYIENMLRGSVLSFYTGQTNTERLRITAAGDVGIGNTSPTVKLDVNGDIKATNITASGSMTLTGKATSAATAATDAATTLSTKGYVESTARIGSTICFSKTGVATGTTIVVAGVTVTVGNVVQGSGGAVPFNFPSGTAWSGFAFIRTNGSAARTPTHFDSVASFTMSGDASNEPTSNTFIIIATRVS